MSVRYSIVSPVAIIGPIRRVVAAELLAGGYHIRSQWAENIPHKWPGPGYGHAPGNTGRDLKVELRSDTEVVISTGTISGKALETGAVPHVIRPRGRHKLRWPSERGGFGRPGEIRERWQAQHPGVQARGIGDRAVRQNLLHIYTRLITAIRAVSR